MDMKARIGLLVQAQGAKRASSEIAGVAKSVDNVGDKSVAAGRKMKGARAAASGFQRGLKGLSTTMKYGAVAAVALGIAIGKGAITEYRDAYKTTRATTNAIRSSGHAANVTAKQVGNLANATSLKTGIDDEAIQGAENLLLTFKKVHNEAGRGNKIFNQATKTAIDMSAAYGQSLKTSSIQLGKALQDPVKGAAALKRVGAIDQHDIDTIKAMAKAHRSLGDQQKYVLDAINSAGVKGRATAIADPFDKAKVAWNNLKETLGYGIAPYVKKALAPFTPFARDLSRIFGRKDLDFGEKMRLSLDSAKRNFGPFLSTLWNSIRSADLPQKLMHGFDVALPFIVDHIAAVAPRAAALFVHAFVNMGPWGQLLTVVYLAKKLGVFSVLGRMAAAKFVAAAGAPAGAGFAATALKSAIPAMTAAAPWIAVGLAIAAVVAYAFDKDFRKKVNKTINDIADFAQTHYSDATGVGSTAGLDAGLRNYAQPGPHGFGTGTGATPAPSPNAGKGGGSQRDSVTAKTSSVAPGKFLELHTHLHQDGRETATVVRRVALADLLAASTS